MLVLLSLLLNLYANDIQINQVKIPLTTSGETLDLTFMTVKKDLLAASIQGILQNEEVKKITYTYGDDLQTLSKIEPLIEGHSSKKIAAEDLNNMVSKKSFLGLSERSNFRLLLIIRSAGLGASLFFTTGSSLSIAAFAGITNILMMDYLYIPKKDGQMRGVDFVSRLMDKSRAKMQKIRPNTSESRLVKIEALTNFLTNFAMNYIMLVPFVGMTGADFKTYLDTFMQSEIYIRSLYIGIFTTIFMSSWKMAMSRWQELKKEKGIEIATNKTQSRIVNGVDFFLSFVTPGFWAGHLANQVVVGFIGVSGFIAYYYHDLQTKLKRSRILSALYPYGSCKFIFM